MVMLNFVTNFFSAMKHIERWFQQDGVMCHEGPETTTLHTKFPDHVVSRNADIY